MKTWAQLAIPDAEPDRFEPIPAGRELPVSEPADALDAELVAALRADAPPPDRPYGALVEQITDLLADAHPLSVPTVDLAARSGAKRKSIAAILRARVRSGMIESFGPRETPHGLHAYRLSDAAARERGILAPAPDAPPADPLLEVINASLAGLRPAIPDSALHARRLRQLARDGSQGDLFTPRLVAWLDELAALIDR